MSVNDSLPILNPNTYLNYLEPSVAIEYEITRNIFLVAFGALLWDILSSVPDDWKLVRTTKVSPVLFAYFSSRTCALVVVLLSVLETTGSIRSCGVAELITWIFWVLATGSSSYLFLKRTHAIFYHEQLVCHGFTVLWVVTMGASTVVLVGPLHDYHQIANTKHCVNTIVRGYVSAAFFVSEAFDAIVFHAITFKILKSNHTATKRRSWWPFCKSRAPPRISQAVLQGGQQYYLITNSVNLTSATVASSSNIPPVLQLAPAIPAIALTSAMACRVFRNLKLEALQKTEAGLLTTIQFADRERTIACASKNAGATSVEASVEQC